MRTVKFIHISDVLLGIDVDKETSWGDDRKKEIYETFEKIIERATDIGVDFLFISGNLFDHKPDDGELEWLDGVLGSLKDTVVIYAADLTTILVAGRRSCPTGSDPPCVSLAVRRWAAICHWAEGTGMHRPRWRWITCIFLRKT